MTAPFNASSPELNLLRAIASGKPVPALTGIITNWNGPPDDNFLGPATSTMVHAIPEAGGPKYQSLTDSAGAFAFNQLPAGSYQIALDLPVGLNPAFTDFGHVNDGHLPTIQIASSSGIACHADIWIGPSGGIRGTLRFPADHSVEGWVNADTVTQDGMPWSTVLSTRPEPDGTFNLEHLRAGRYQIQFIAREGFVRGEPKVIELRDGEQIKGIVLVAK